MMTRLPVVTILIEETQVRFWPTIPREKVVTYDRGTALEVVSRIPDNSQVFVFFDTFVGNGTFNWHPQDGHECQLRDALKQREYSLVLRGCRNVPMRGTIPTARVLALPVKKVDATTGSEVFMESYNVAEEPPGGMVERNFREITEIIEEAVSRSVPVPFHAPVPAPVPVPAQNYKWQLITLGLAVIVLFFFAISKIDERDEEMQMKNWCIGNQSQMKEWFIANQTKLVNELSMAMNDLTQCWFGRGYSNRAADEVSDCQGKFSGSSLVKCLTNRFVACQNEPVRGFFSNLAQHWFGQLKNLIMGH